MALRTDVLVRTNAAQALPVPRLRKHFASPSRGWLLLLSPTLVALTTWPLFLLQSMVGRAEGHVLRPFDIGYLVPILFVTVLGGRAVGALTLLFAAFASAFILSEPYFSIHLLHARDRAELLMLLLVGSSVVAVSGVFHAALRDLGEALAAAQIEIAVRAAAAEEGGVGRLRSCVVGRLGLDYHVTLKVTASPGLSASEEAHLPDRLEAAVRRLDPFIAHVEVILTD